MEFFLISLLNGISYGLLLFMMAAGLTLIFSMMGVLNFAHASFYMLGAYFAYSVVATLQGVPGLSRAAFWIALFIAPVLVGLLGALVQRYGLRRVHRWGHVHELLVTFGLSFVILELVQLAWGKVAVPYRVPPELDGTLFTLFTTQFPIYRGFMMAVSVAMLGGLWLLLNRTRIGLVIQAALTHPDAVQALGHNVPRVFMLVFGGGCLLAGLAGVIGGNAFVTDPSMAMAVGPIIFVVTVVGGMGSLAGAFIASLVIGIIQVMATGVNASLATFAGWVGWTVTPETPLYPVLSIGIAQIAPILPYLLLVLVLIFRPRGLMGTRET
ncbi:branched-chain amino acid ABC transporter permease [Achromobacter sp. GG226]|uniref:branched-chain amino acid ABC transporter permease n=1 Tax=Verticiella alkaliphila TaxID=2779529 RepID=UPI001C0DB5C6|nr:branched-chain amino acid ABC transporter permease [Verticiella sp. GG226]MBU4611701.1 branched-chain amino acid ABC transporter permease [Verticiella sp. GG226]